MSHYKPYWVKIKTSDGSKILFPDTSYTDPGVGIDKKNPEKSPKKCIRIIPQIVL